MGKSFTFLGINLPGSEAEYSPLYTAEVKTESVYIFIPSMLSWHVQRHVSLIGNEYKKGMPNTHSLDLI